MPSESTLLEILDSILDEVPTIKSDRKYWFVRTNGGEYYDSFIKGGYIAIGYNEISLSAIQVAKNNDSAGIENLTLKIKETYKEEESRPGHVASQLVRFAYQIKKGDIVLIPNENSHTIHFGEIASTPTDIVRAPNDKCPYQKRKRVKWIKSVRRNKLDADFYKLMFSHQTITDASDYAGFIDRTLNSLFIKGDETHLVLDVNTTDEINAKSLFSFGNALNLTEELCSDESIDNPDFNVKLNVQSPGTIEITAVVALGVIALGLILVTISGGGLTFKYKTADKTDINATLKTDGIIEKMRNYLNSKSARKSKADILKKSLEDLKLTNPDDLINILKELSDNKK